MNEQSDTQGAGRLPLEEFLKLIGPRTKALASVSLFAMRGKDRALSEILAGSPSLNGELGTYENGRSAPVHFALDRIGDDPPTFRLKAAGLPPGGTPLAVFLGKFVHWQFEPVEGTFSLSDADKPRRAEGDADASSVAEPYLTVAADDGEESEADEECFLLRADEGFVGIAAAYGVTEEQSMEPGNAKDGVARDRRLGQPAGVVSRYCPRIGTLEVSASLPEGGDGETVVAELQTGSGQDERIVRRAVHLDCRLDGGRYKANVFHFLPAAKRGEVKLVVRPTTTDDLSLLEPKAVQALLARSCYVSMPVERTGDGFVFRACWPHQRQAAAETSACWALAVATGKEGRP